MSDPGPRAFPPGRRVLVVEDQFVAAEDLRQELEGLGVEVLGPVGSVARALALLQVHAAPDAAILNINLGEETVYPVADVLRARGVPFIFVTGYDASAIPEAYAQVPRCEKPFVAERCLEAMLRVSPRLD